LKNSALYQQRQRTDGELRGYPAKYLGPSDMAPQCHVTTSCKGKGCVTSNDSTHSEDFQWVTHNDGEFSPTNIPPRTCRYDADMREIERAVTPEIHTLYRDWAYLNDGPVDNDVHKARSDTHQDSVYRSGDSDRAHGAVEERTKRNAGRPRKDELHGGKRPHTHAETPKRKVGRPRKKLWLYRHGHLP
jgi:hypothetical protein